MSRRLEIIKERLGLDPSTEFNQSDLKRIEEMGKRTNRNGTKKAPSPNVEIPKEVAPEFVNLLNKE